MLRSKIFSQTHLFQNKSIIMNLEKFLNMLVICKAIKLLIFKFAYFSQYAIDETLENVFNNIASPF